MLTAVAASGATDAASAAAVDEADDDASAVARLDAAAAEPGDGENVPARVSRPGG